MSYIYETHLHTTESSACGKSHGKEYLKHYQDMGYAGIIVTDHFFNGNCAVPSSLPWKERVEAFCRGYELTKEAGDAISFPVFFGWEACFQKDEYLIYGLDKQWLLDHPEILEWDHITHYQKIKEAGGLVVQAHPFRERDYIPVVNVHPFQCDAFEVANACNPVFNDLPAYEYAKKHHIPMTAGSDIHHVSQAEAGNCFGVAFDQPITSMKDFVTRIKNAQNTLFIPDDYFNEPVPTALPTPICFFDQNNNPSSCSLSELL